MKNSDIRRYYVNRRSPLFLIYTTRETDIEEFPSIKAHLEKFRPLLESKRECREGKLPWFSLHWPRDQRIFEGEKIVTPNRAFENTFALSESSLYGMSDIFFITSNCQEEEPGYVLAILNSQVMNQWFWSNRKPKGRIGEYVGTPLERIPIRRIDFSDPADVEIHHRMLYLARAMNTSNDEETVELQSEIDSLITRLYGLKSSTNLL
ncbi:MAG: TaqI-like C-terminal specificity domain-containing protein, partial [Dehalococcoidia bacterium]